MDSTTGRPRPKAIEYSDWYGRRLEIHKIGSYAMLPLFGTEYYLGERLIEGRASGNEKSLHTGVATAIGGLFAVNTVTGAWNLWDSRTVPQGRTRRTIHTLLMLASDAGFAYAGIKLSEDAEESADARRKHRNTAYASMGVAVTGAGMMLLWRD